MACSAASCCQLMRPSGRAHARRCAMVSTACTISLTVTLSDGRFIARVWPNADAGMSCTCTSARAMARADAIGISVSGRSGHTMSCPRKGSRTMLATRSEIDVPGAPGRTSTIGRRSVRPSTWPRRE